MKLYTVTLDATDSDVRERDEGTDSAARVKVHLPPRNLVAPDDAAHARAPLAPEGGVGVFHQPACNCKLSQKSCKCAWERTLTATTQTAAEWEAVSSQAGGSRLPDAKATRNRYGSITPPTGNSPAQLGTKRALPGVGQSLTRSPSSGAGRGVERQGTATSGITESTSNKSMRSLKSESGDAPEEGSGTWLKDERQRRLSRESDSIGSAKSGDIGRRMSVRTDTLNARLQARGSSARQGSGEHLNRFLSMEERQTVEIAHDPIRKEFITFREPTIEKILEENPSTRQYKVKWEGLLEEHGTWEAKQWCQTSFESKVDEFRLLQGAKEPPPPGAASPGGARSLKRAASNQSGSPASRGKKTPEQVQSYDRSAPCTTTETFLEPDPITTTS